MSLKEYQRKRDFRKTPEPTGNRASKSAARRFVVQKHAASRLHYDFRLELDGTLRSWAVPKGPSLDSSVKSLAIQVEDHPLDYAGFEGIIPQGEYGGGTVMVWDRGTWEPDGDAAKGLKNGKLTFELFGEKLKGGWSLVRMSGRAEDGGKNWLLIKRSDKQAQPSKKNDILGSKPLSVLSGRDMKEIAADGDRVWNTKDDASTDGSAHAKSRRNTRTADNKKATGNGPIRNSDVARLPEARKARQPREFQPQLAKLAAEVPIGDEWLHELKFDGYRILAFVTKGKVRLATRNGNDWTRRFGSVARAVEAIGLPDAILDGEVVSVGNDGISDFQQLQNLLKRGDEGLLAYYVFDLPYFDGFDLTRTPLAERKALLARAIRNRSSKTNGVVRYSDHIQGQGSSVLEQACRSAVEGIVCKWVDSAYVQGRTAAWLKVKCLKRQEFVIGGYTKPSGSRRGFGALLLGYYESGKLIYCGRVGTGFTSDSLRQISVEMKKLKADAPPFANPPTGSQRRGVTWIRPELVGEVEFTEWTDEGLLRHPSFQGLREDKPAKEIVREQELRPAQIKRQAKRDRVMTATKRTKAAHSTGNGPDRSAVNKRSRSTAKRDEAVVVGVRLTHPDRVLYPDQGLTKQGLAQFYERIAEWILPHVVDRPLTLVRCPDGQAGRCFYQKHLTESLPNAIGGVMVQEKGKKEEYVVIDDLAGLLSLVQMGVLEIHPWLARVDQLERPDRLVFDLDPGEHVGWSDVIDAAKDVRKRLTDLGLTSFLRTSGGKGLHVVAPITRRNTWDELKEFARGVADDLVRSSTDRYVATMSKAKRRGKVFIDYLRNQRGATAIASYSTRARAAAPVAAPLSWHELTAKVQADQFTVANLPRRLKSLRKDPWEGFFTQRQSITAAMQKAVGR